jgi:hypothetical protein
VHPRYLATRRGIGWLEALTQALDGNPWIPGAALASPHCPPGGPGAGLGPAATAKSPARCLIEPVITGSMFHRGGLAAGRAGVAGGGGRRV